FGLTDSAEFGAMNPNRTVPVLQDGSLPPLWETGAILRYLATAYAPESFWPQDLWARTEVDRWAEWAKINIAQGFTAPIFWRVVRTAPADQDPQAIRRAVAALEAKLAIADARLGAHPFLVADRFTLADVQFGHILYRYYDIDIARGDLPHLRSYYDRLTTRPSFRKHVMLSYGGLRVQ
ncbi:MAG: glutathione binding-like protein, partial [Pseudorhodobacter sp.]